SDALTAADARRAHAVARLGAAQLVSEVRCDASAARAERMAERDRAAVRVALLHREAELLLNGEPLRSECLIDVEEIDLILGQAGAIERAPEIDVEEIDLILGQAGAIERAPDRRRRADAHDRRLDSRDAPLHEARERSEAARLGPFAVGDDEHRRAVADARRV